MFDIETIEATLQAKVDEIGAIIDKQSDAILAGFDTAVEKIKSLPEDTDMDEWVKENPQYDINNIKKLQEEVLATDWSDLDAGNQLLGQVGKITGQGEINLNSVHAQKIEEDFQNTMKNLEAMAEKLGNISGSFREQHSEEL